jgi:hypothetical protein
MGTRCIVHQAMADYDRHEMTVCPKCLPKARNLLANLQLEIDTGLLDPNDVDDNRVSGYRVLAALIEGRQF